MHFRTKASLLNRWTAALMALVIAVLVALNLSSASAESRSSKPPSSVPSFIAQLAEPPLDYEGGGAFDQAKSDAEGLRVLFVGNSFTHRNNMVAILNELSKRDNQKGEIFAVQFAPPESTLAQKVDSPAFDEVLRAAKWDVVILQEQSKIPSFPDTLRRAQMDPAVQTLHAKISAIGARTSLFMTWGYQEGDDINVPNDTYEAMQQRLADGYFTVGREQRIPVVPIGFAWRDAHAKRSDLALWASDGVHPSQLGSYFVAQLFYKELTGKNPPKLKS